MNNSEILKIFTLDYDVDLSLTKKRDNGVWSPKQVGKEPYTATIRFLPIPVYQESSIVGTEKEPYYMKIRYYLRDKNGVGHYFDSPRTIDEKCPISSAYFGLKNTKNIIDANKADTLKTQKNFWSLVYIIDDTVDPTNNGKIRIFKYTSDLQEKIDIENKKRGVKVWDLFNGVDMELTVTTKSIVIDKDNNVKIEKDDFSKCEFDRGNRKPLNYNGYTFNMNDSEVTTKIVEMYKNAPDISMYKYKPFTEQELAHLNIVLENYRPVGSGDLNSVKTTFASKPQNSIEDSTEMFQGQSEPDETDEIDSLLTQMGLK